jgi:hypothetical protein
LEEKMMGGGSDQRSRKGVAPMGLRSLEWNGMLSHVKITRIVGKGRMKEEKG